ncbi:exodeoxyribonuclease VII small subunit [Pseudomonadales bacterium]|jgi:exodeoxyribonuclease VII small subunit|nr:exodeoxyribonuclease VII small subunit [Pseudomonadales bacterium]MDB4404700.1 exodeoxyribonuclease VII small subunit [bacterium]MDB4362879.1 exodeoxyribonuclease VII small subunit [Pseudomonadales bacterium]MDB4430735.1 exodeoxyribonuclease VII small subunit [bacterium]MDB4431463.1 exodeoxyribonuclease VII small subunit [Pseudomonadales bacterium]
MARSKKTPDFETSLERLEEIVECLETGDLSLEQSLKQFEEGVSLTRACQTALTDAEQTIKVLTEKNAELQLNDLDTQSIDD